MEIQVLLDGLGLSLGIRIRELELRSFCYDRIKGSFRVEKIFFKKFSIFYLWFWKYTKYYIYVEKNNLEYVNSGYESTKAEHASVSLLGI